MGAFWGGEFPRFSSPGRGLFAEAVVSCRLPSSRSAIVASMTFRSVLLLLVLAFAAGCAGSGRVDSETPEEAFEEGKALYERGKYTRAVEFFQHVFDFGRANPFAADAQYYLAKSYYDDEQYLLSANEFTRFAELYRGDERVEEAEYLRAMSYYQLSPPYQLDQTDTQTALTYIRLYLSKYPEGEYAAELGELTEKLRAKLAKKQFEIAELYERRELFEAAALSFERVLEEYPDSRYADDALLGMLRNYAAYAEASVPSRQPERYQLAADAYARLVQLFPQSPLLDEAEEVHAGVSRALGQFNEQARID
jgi:outer membrane protein assembly factor BamD